MSHIKPVRVRDVMKTEFDRVDGIRDLRKHFARMKHPEVRSFNC